MGRAPCCDKVGLKKGPWTVEEDQTLSAYINQHGHGSWRALPKKAGLLRCGKSCRLRWTNYLRPDIKRGEFSASEEQTIIHLHALLGNKWSAIAAHLPKRTDNEIKNYWNTHLKKRLIKMGLDPVTHKPQTPSITLRTNNAESSEPLRIPKATGGSSAITHMAQWESVRLEAEARLAREAEMRAKEIWLPTVSTLARPFPSAGPQAPLVTGGHWMMPTKQQEAGSCNAINVLPSHMTKDNSSSSAYLASSLERCPSVVMNMRLKGEVGACPGNALSVNSTELFNSLHNWENSLQGQAGMMWPDSWKLFTNSIVSNSGPDCQESSSCSSPSHGTSHGSPTSTLCSLDGLSKTAAHPAQVRKLCWSDNNFLSISNPLLSHNQLLRPPPCTQRYIDDGLRDVAKNQGNCGAGGRLSNVCLLQELGSLQNDADNDESEVGSLFIDSNSRDFLGDLELDVSSSSYQSAASGRDDDMCKVSSYSVLLALGEEEYSKSEWNSASVLKEDPEEDQATAV
ncbi:hypothetical protein GOP47_0014254 [Adiantum capillus-veneris]|uniref:Uncharacterized protein n=1 Tax=Adiantum capillus-veneris TaxID=13818 RepID=A0A9D4ZEP3_ADICA|nr:hypothetical protein GOP47_0014254 [Adiantum capillus-veneris]